MAIPSVVGLERNRLLVVRESYVALYLAHLASASDLLYRTVAADTGLTPRQGPSLHQGLETHLSDFLTRLQGFPRALQGISWMQRDPHAVEFVDSLAREAIHGVSAQAFVDVTRIARYRSQIGMGVLATTRLSAGARRAAAAQFIADNIFRLDSMGRRLLTERYVRGLFNVALFRARNETYVGGHPGRPFIVYREGHQPVRFGARDYAQVVRALHPFAEPIVMVDNGIAKRV
jgi:hypothetical protein